MARMDEAFLRQLFTDVLAAKLALRQQNLREAFKRLDMLERETRARLAHEVMLRIKG